MQLTFRHGQDAFDALGPAWDALATRDQASPFTTQAWLSTWWQAYGEGSPLVATATDAATGALQAAALLRRRAGRGLASTTNVHSGDWGIVAAGPSERHALVTGLVAQLRPVHVTLTGLRGEGLTETRAALRAAGQRTEAVLAQASPYLELPSTFDELMSRVSANRRSQVRRRTRGLERAGSVRLRTVTGGPELEPTLDALLRVEASGWKGRAGSAILGDPAAEHVYRGFARGAAEHGWLRLYALELDGQVIAADLGCVIGEEAFLVKTGFDEAFSRLSPGVVLRARVLEASIAEGLRGYDFLGGPDEYKLQWTSLLRPRATVRAFGGAAVLAAALHRRAVRPLRRRLAVARAAGTDRARET